MSAPKRWLDEGGGATPLERDLLRGGAAIDRIDPMDPMDPPEGAQGAVWAALIAKLPPPVPAGGGGSGASGAGTGKAAAAAKTAASTKAASGAGAAMGTGVVKAALLGAGGAIALITGYSVVVPSAPDPQPAPIESAAPATSVVPPRSSRSAPPSPAQPARDPEPDPTAARSPTASSPPQSVEHHADPRPSAPSVAAEPAARETAAREESEKVAEAREALRRGDHGRALALLEQIRARFPGGVLVQEREALAIEALYRSGRRGEASVRAAAFLKAYPSSPLAERVRVFAN